MHSTTTRPKGCRARPRNRLGTPRPGPAGNRTPFRVVVAGSIQWLLLVLALFPAPLVWGAADTPQPEVLLLAGEASGVYREVASTVLARAAGRPWRFLGLDEDTEAGLAEALARQPPGLLVTLGRQAALAVPRLGYPGPVLYALIPEGLYRGLPGCCARTRHPGTAPSGVLFLDQPLNRQMELIAAALPGRQRVGVLLGPESRWAGAGLERAAREAGLTPVLREIETGAQLGPVFRELLEDIDVLLALPDPEVHNRSTVTALLLGSYRAGVPLVAFSEAYVKAGALLALYATPGQIGEQIAEALEVFSASGTLGLRDPVHPTRFNVAINPNVARSLNIDLPDAPALETRIRGQEP